MLSGDLSHVVETIVSFFLSSKHPFRHLTRSPVPRNVDIQPCEKFHLFLLQPVYLYSNIPSRNAEFVQKTEDRID